MSAIPTSVPLAKLTKEFVLAQSVIHVKVRSKSGQKAEGLNADNTWSVAFVPRTRDCFCRCPGFLYRTRCRNIRRTKALFALILDEGMTGLEAAQNLAKETKHLEEAAR